MLADCLAILSVGIVRLRELIRWRGRYEGTCPYAGEGSVDTDLEVCCYGDTVYLDHA
jgi:hypothetical protein